MLAHENPFRADCIEALRFRAPDTGIDVLLSRLARHGGRGALVGPKGSGKTTLLEELAAVLRLHGESPLLVRLSASRHRVDWIALRQGLDSATPPSLLVDGVEQLGTLAWWRLRLLARRAPLFVVTTHKAGRLPLLHRHATSPGLLHELVRELLRGSVDTPPPSDDELRALFARHHGDIRLCLRELYDRHSSGATASSRTLSNQYTPAGQ